MEREKVENIREKQPYETPRVTEHGSVGQITGGGEIRVSAIGQPDDPA
jgi:hypothetical protein